MSGAGKKRLTLTQVLAQRAQQAQEAEAHEQERLRRLSFLEDLRSQPGCTCPDCMRLRQARGSDGQA
jgi:hypothetical protein